MMPVGRRRRSRVGGRGMPAHDGATQVIVSPSTSTSPSKATSGVTTVPASSSRSGQADPGRRRAARSAGPPSRRAAVRPGVRPGIDAGSAIRVPLPRRRPRPSRSHPATHPLRRPRPVPARAPGSRPGRTGWPPPACIRSPSPTRHRDRARRPKHCPAAVEAVGPPTPTSAGVTPQVPPLLGAASRRQASGVTELMNESFTQTCSPGATRPQAAPRPAARRWPTPPGGSRSRR